MAQGLPAADRAAIDASGDRLDITQFLAGTTRAHGFFQDRFGRIRRVFEITMTGHWVGPVFLLDEEFIYDDGEREQRTWRIVPGPDGTFGATCPDCIGVAKGIAQIGRWHMRYGFRLKLRSSTIAVTFDDHVYVVDANLAINRAVVSKWGFRLGEVMIVFERQLPSDKLDYKPSLASRQTSDHTPRPMARYLS